MRRSPAGTAADQEGLQLLPEARRPMVYVGGAILGEASPK
jgi:hypothetical protein